MSWPFPGIPPGEYGAILCDKPWRFKLRSDKPNNRSTERHYRTMTDAELMALPVRDLCARDTFLFMWSTGAMVKRSIALMEHWGFEYSSFAFIWLKLNKRSHQIFWTRRDFFKGMGYTTRKNAEICILGRFGEPKRISKNVDELIIAPKREHSRKPDEIYDRVQAFAQGPYCELFSRAVPRPGWSAFGNEVGKFGEAA